MEHHVSSIIRGHHVSKSFWTPAIDEIMTAICNTIDRFAVALSASGVRRTGEARIEGQSRECGGPEARRCGSGDVHHHIIAPAPSRTLSALYHCRSIPISCHLLRSEAHALNKQY